MAKGRQKYEARQQALLSLGTQLNRRASSKCELCSSGGVPLRPHEVEPQSDRPEVDRCILICGSCTAGVEGSPSSPGEWRFLEEVAWTELAPLQVAAVRILRGFSDSQSWAAALLESLYLAPEVEDWLNS